MKLRAYIFGLLLIGSAFVFAQRQVPPGIRQADATEINRRLQLYGPGISTIPGVDDLAIAVDGPSYERIEKRNVIRSGTGHRRIGSTPREFGRSSN